MNLTRSGFELLTLLERKGKGKYSQKSLANELSFSVGIVNKLLNEFVVDGLIDISDEISITDKGILELKPYRVKRAIIIAAGFSERLVPITLSTPKPLVKVKGKRIIDTIIDSLINVGIDDITVVTGYKKKDFLVLSEKYPNIKFLENPLYNQSGNITTLYSAKDNIDRCYICDADLYIHNPEIFRKYEYSSCFLGIPVRETDDWCFTLNGRNISEFKVGGEKCFKTVFITYLDSKDSELLRDGIEKMVNSLGGKEHHWFDVIFGKDQKKYNIQSRECYFDDVSEIDTMGDLVKLDDSYLNLEIND